MVSISELGNPTKYTNFKFIFKLLYYLKFYYLTILLLKFIFPQFLKVFIDIFENLIYLYLKAFSEL